MDRFYDLLNLARKAELFSPFTEQIIMDYQNIQRFINEYLPLSKGFELHFLGAAHDGNPQTLPLVKKSQDRVYKIFCWVRPDIIGVEGSDCEIWSVQNSLEEAIDMGYLKSESSSEIIENKYFVRTLTKYKDNYPSCRLVGSENLNLFQLQIAILDKMSQGLSGKEITTLNILEFSDQVSFLRTKWMISKLTKIALERRLKVIGTAPGKHHYRHASLIQTELRSERWHLVDTTSWLSYITNGFI